MWKLEFENLTWSPCFSSYIYKEVNIKGDASTFSNSTALRTKIQPEILYLLFK